MAQSNSIPPNTQEYGGDEISALVVDPGYSTVRAGYAGEDAPKSVLSTAYGFAKDHHVWGDDIHNAQIPGLEIRNPMSADGTVEDWDAASKLWQYAIHSRLTNPKPDNPYTNGLNPDLKQGEAQAMDIDAADEGDSLLRENPLLMSEQGWNSSKNREKAIETALEDWGAPAFWLARNGVLASFASGKATALVVDVGASSASVTPVHDGLVLRKGTARSPYAGNYISEQARHLLSSTQPPTKLTPHYMILSKSAVDANAPPIATYRTFPPSQQPTASYHRFQEDRLVAEFKESVVQVWGGPGRLMGHSPTNNSLNEEQAKAMPGRSFEFPNGYNQMLTVERFRPAEALFDKSQHLQGPGSETYPAPTAKQTVLGLIAQTLENVDIDIRPNLLTNIVVVGGTTLTQGFVERLNSELAMAYPGPKVRINASGNPIERKYAGWIGGSILASLGTFHQMWISKKEYDEHGPSIVEKRCK